MVTTVYGRQLSHKHMIKVTHHILITRQSDLIRLPRSLLILERINQTFVHADLQSDRMSQSFPMIPSFRSQYDSFDQ